LIAESREPQKAESLLRKSVSLDGAYWESHYLLGILLGNRGAFAEAEKELRRSTELNPKDPAPHYRLFRALAALGRTQEAEAELAVQRKVAAAWEADLNRSLSQVKRLDLGESNAAAK
jgi:Flp pilus assembly protein TadD